MKTDSCGCPNMYALVGWLVVDAAPSMHSVAFITMLLLWCHMIVAILVTISIIIINY